MKGTNKLNAQSAKITGNVRTEQKGNIFKIYFDFRNQQKDQEITIHFNEEILDPLNFTIQNLGCVKNKISVFFCLENKPETTHKIATLQKIDCWSQPDANTYSFKIGATYEKNKGEIFVIKLVVE